MAAKLTRLTHKIAIQLHLVAENFNICSSRSRWPVRKLLDTPSYFSVSLVRGVRAIFFNITNANTWAVPQYRRSYFGGPGSMRG
jgi:hypothetical protein